MNLVLKRHMRRSDGIFGNIYGQDDSSICRTLEHAYSVADTDAYAPILQPGTYKCVRGIHRIGFHLTPIETFEVTGVKGHTGILFHYGNYNADSNGCVLVGDHIVDAGGTTKSLMLTHSRVTFAHFMDLQKDIDNFTLTVIDL